jgi:hypothetical protein
MAPLFRVFSMTSDTEIIGKGFDMANQLNLDPNSWRPDGSSVAEWSRVFYGRDVVRNCRSGALPIPRKKGTHLSVNLETPNISSQSSFLGLSSCPNEMIPPPNCRDKYSDRDFRAFYKNVVFFSGNPQGCTNLANPTPPKEQKVR